MSDGVICPNGTVEIKNSCIPISCVNSFRDHKLICNNGGMCVPLGKNAFFCNCDAKHALIDGICMDKTCLFVNAHDETTICNAKGTCNPLTSSCECSPGEFNLACGECYSNTIFTMTPLGYACVPATCVNDGLVCNGHGMCATNPSNNFSACLCDEDYIVLDGSCVATSTYRIRMRIKVAMLGTSCSLISLVVCIVIAVVVARTIIARRKLQRSNELRWKTFMERVAVHNSVLNGRDSMADGVRIDQK